MRGGGDTLQDQVVHLRSGLQTNPDRAVDHAARDPQIIQSGAVRIGPQADGRAAGDVDASTSGAGWDRCAKTVDEQLLVNRHRLVELAIRQVDSGIRGREVDRLLQPGGGGHTGRGVGQIHGPGIPGDARRRRRRSCAASADQPVYVDRFDTGHRDPGGKPRTGRARPRNRETAGEIHPLIRSPSGPTVAEVEHLNAIDIAGTADDGHIRQATSRVGRPHPQRGGVRRSPGGIRDPRLIVGGVQFDLQRVAYHVGRHRQQRPRLEGLGHLRSRPPPGPQDLPSLQRRLDTRPEKQTSNQIGPGLKLHGGFLVLRKEAWV